jgi:NitT/TauT family transport system permease protein
MGRALRRVVTPKEPISRAAAIALGIAGVLVVFGVWAYLSYGHVLSTFFLPSPSKTASATWDLFAHQDFLADVWASARRVILGFVLAAALAIPLGIAIGSYRVAQAFFEPVIAAVRYMPASAFVPLFIIWFGIAETEKLAVICFGVFFPLTLLIADVSANVSKELVNIAYTLGGSRGQVFRKVLVPACWPGVVDALRIGIGWGWTYLILAELVAAQSGIGHMIIQSSRFLQTENILGGILVIGVLGLLTDAFFRWLYRRLFPYAERVR